HGEDQFLPRHGRPPSPGRGRGALVSAKRGLAFRQHEARLGISPARSAAWHFASTKPGLALRQREAQLGPSPARSPAWPFASAKRSLALVQLEARAGVPLARGPAWHPVCVKP